MRKVDCCLSICLSLLLLSISGCGGSSQPEYLLAAPSPGSAEPAAEGITLPTSLPQDRLQPWEHGTSSLSGDSIVLPGRDYFLASSSGHLEQGEALRLFAPPQGGTYAMYRLSTGGKAPGLLSLDVNLLHAPGKASPSYYAAYSDYSSGRWVWQGPFNDSHVRLPLPEQLGLSSAGNLFACILVSSGISVDVVALGLDTRSAGDGDAPPRVAGLVASPVVAGLELQWNPVIAGDLAGYRIYWSTHGFISPHSAGVRSRDYLEGSTHALIRLPAGTSWVRVTGVDINGNEGLPSDAVSAAVLPGTAPALELHADTSSVLRGDPISVSLSGAESYDIDADGDGSFETSDSSLGSFAVDTERIGIIRPRVRAHDAAGEAVALGSLSVFITGNTRPVASASAEPQSGVIPFSVTFTGLADDAEDLATGLSYAWDFDGDGIYEDGTDTLSPAPQSYSVAGNYNVKFRVTDSSGAWDVDTLSILAQPAANLSPQAAFQADTTSGISPLLVSFNASASSDSDGELVEYAWDWGEHGGYELFSDGPLASHVYTAAGLYSVKLRVRDDSGGFNVSNISIGVNVSGNVVPVASLDVAVSSGTVPYTADFDASGSYDPDGSIVEYAWDWDGNGAYDSFSTEPEVSYTYYSPGVHFVRVRVTDDKGAQATDVFGINAWAPYNNKPLAVIELSTHSGLAPLTVILDGSESSDDSAIDEYAWDWEGDGTYDAVSDVAIVSHTYAQPGVYLPVLRVTDDDGAEDTKQTSLTVSLAGNSNPVAVLASDRTDGFNELTVSLDASGSYDPDGSIVLIEWDFDGDGIYESYGTTPTSSLYLDHIGNFNPRIRVTDDKGAQGIGGVWIAVNEVLNPLHPWGNSGFNLRNTRRSGNNGPDDNNLRWSFATGASVNGSPAVSQDGTVYVGCSDWKLYAINPDGTEKWSYLAGDIIEGCPALDDDGNIYFGSLDHNVYALDPAGNLLWSFPTGDYIYAGPLVAPDGTIYIGSFDHNLYALNQDGSEAWSYPTGGAIWDSVGLASDGTIYVGSGDKKLHAVNSDGSAKWSYLSTDSIGTTPAVGADGTIFVRDGDDHTIAINPDGTLRWQLSTSTTFGSGNSVAIGLDGTLYYFDNTKKLNAVHPDGTLRWSVIMANNGNTNIAIGLDGKLYFGSNDHKIYAFNPDGTQAFSYVTPAMTASQPAIGSDGVVYIGFLNNMLYAIGDSLP